MSDNLEFQLNKFFGFKNFRPGQATAIRNLLEGKHTLIVMPTGSGKSLIFQLTALLKPGVTLVISPLIALMKDQVDTLKTRGISSTFINSSLSRNDLSSRLSNLSSGQYQLVYIAPERLRSIHFLNALRNQKVTLLVVDEAHCISEWGHDFRPDYLHIAQFRAAINNPLTVALTATATPKVQDDITRLLGISDAQRVVTGFNRPNLALEVHYVTDQSMKLKVLRKLVSGLTEGAVIIYTGTRRDAEEVAEFINSVVRINAQYYHAGLPAEQRSHIQDQFMTGELSVVAATNAFGMGIDRPDVRQVIHFSVTGSLEAYYQEAGRAGRDELPAKAVLLYSPDDRALQEWFIENSVITQGELRQIYESLRPFSENEEAITFEDLSRLTSLQEIKVRIGMAELERAGFLERLGDQGFSIWVKLNGWKVSALPDMMKRLAHFQAHRKAQLERMIFYAETNSCRRRIILNHFGDRGPVEVEICCDNCEARKSKKPSDDQEKTATQQVGPGLTDQITLVILDTVRRLTRGVGRDKLSQILKGSKAKDIVKFGYSKCIYYGRLRSYPQEKIQKRIVGLVETGDLKVVGGKYPVLELTPQGETVIKNSIITVSNLNTTHNTKREQSTNNKNNPEKEFLTSSHPRKLSGPWKSGWALDFHSRFSGADWSRSETGELAYRLKYQNDISVLPQLLDQAAALLSQHPELAQVDAVVPVPPSIPRLNDPVSSFSRALSKRLNLAFLPVLIKSRPTNPQKEMHTLAQKRLNVTNAFDLQSSVKNKRLLVVDDLYDSGATLDEINRLLTRAGAKHVYVLTLTRTIHSDA